MAEGATFESKILCRYFLHGVCNRGQNCHYSHDRQHPLDNVCKFYVKGCCTFADRCRYDHVKPNTPKKSVQSDQRQTWKTGRKPPPLTETSSPSSGMVSLKKALKGDPVTSSPHTPKPPEEWVRASEFIPGQPYQCSSIPSSYADAAANGVNESSAITISEVTSSSQLLCPFSTNKECPYGEECEYMHGLACELCGLAVLEPDNPKQNDEHMKECMEQHEKDMELSFAIARSKDKQCGICMDTVMEKAVASERRFGILSDCTHCFCLSCIRKWRASKQFDNKTIRSCPECRVVSDFVTPSQFWVDSKEEKVKVIQGYKKALSQKPCKYFAESGDCPFSDKCFYAHLNPDGTKAELKPRRHRKRQNADGELSLEEIVTFWDFFQNRQDRLENLLLHLDVIDVDIADMIMSLNLSSDSDTDSDYDEDRYLYF